MPSLLLLFSYLFTAGSALVGYIWTVQKSFSLDSKIKGVDLDSTSGDGYPYDEPTPQPPNFGGQAEAEG